jgi:two-component system nitrate/nitrite response regulator NarL
MSGKIRIAIVDDHVLLREGIASLLEEEEDMEVVGFGGNAKDALVLARDLLPDLILMDLDMPGSGLTAASEIALAAPVSRIVILTVSEEDDNLLKALRAGARAYVLKGISGRELVRILRGVYSGESYVPPALAASLLREMADQPRILPAAVPADPINELSSREREILEQLSTGKSNREIAGSLFLAEKTVKYYITNILQKLQVRNRVEAALLAQKSSAVKDFRPS